MHRMTQILTVLMPVTIAAALNCHPHQALAQNAGGAAQAGGTVKGGGGVKAGGNVQAGGTAQAGGTVPANPNNNNQGNGPNTNPNAPLNTPNGPNQNPYAPFNGPVAGNSGSNSISNNIDNMSGSTIPLGNITTGNFNNLPWFTPFGFYGGSGFNGFGFSPYGYGYNTGYYGVPYTNGYYGVGSGGFGFDNLAGSGLYVQDTNVPETPRTARPAVSNANEEHQVLENAKEANQLYYQFRETNRAYRARQIARDRASPEAAAKAALDDLPRWLGPDELNQASGKISWPAALQSDEFGSLRTAIEDQFRSRARKDSVETTTIIKEQIKEMIGLLRAHIEEMPADEFMTARKFLDSLDYAMHHPVPR